jgi:hypothetical protein
MLGQNCALYGHYLVYDIDGITIIENPLVYDSAEYDNCYTNNSSELNVCEICTGLNSNYYFVNDKCVTYGTAWDGLDLLVINTDTLTDGF